MQSDVAILFVSHPSLTMLYISLLIIIMIITSTAPHKFAIKFVIDASSYNWSILGDNHYAVTIQLI